MGWPWNESSFHMQVNEALQRVDRTIKSLFAGLTMRGIKECVNVIIVSDHGKTISCRGSYEI